MGIQNTPDKGSWRTNFRENSTKGGGIDLYYRDQTGALIINLTDTLISIQRLGSTPSMQYLMQESVVLNGLLDQLDEIAADQSINESDRLICLKDPGDAILVARETLSFS